MDTIKVELELGQGKELSSIYGRLDRNLKVLEEFFGISGSIRGDKIIIQGDEGSVDRAERFLKELKDIDTDGYFLSAEDTRYILKAIQDKPVDEISPILKQYFSNIIPVSSKRRYIIPRSETQVRYIKAIKSYDMVIGIGPAGTGKTYLAMAMAIESLLKKEVSRIVLARPAVEAGEKLGFLPGDMYEKVNPYLRPLYDALFDMMDVERAHKLIERGIIEIAPLAFMRGRTLNDSFIILDEAQNTTSEQMKMYLTRLGFNSKTVITGDITQIDLPPGKVSGLIESQKILSGIEGLCFIYFGQRDVVRHRLVQEIIKAYEEFESRRDKE